MIPILQRLKMIKQFVQEDHAVDEGQGPAHFRII